MKIDCLFIKTAAFICGGFLFPFILKRKKPVEEIRQA